MNNRKLHQKSVESFLNNQFSSSPWEFTNPEGYGNETYFAWRGKNVFFVKLGSHVARYQVIASIGLTPTILSNGFLEDGTSIMVQKYIDGRTPTRRDYQTHLKDFTTAIKKVHHNPQIKQTLPEVSTDQFSTIGLQVLDKIQTRWEEFKSLVPGTSDLVDEGIAQLRENVKKFRGDGLVASHNDICNSNWIITPDDKLYLIDLDSMSIDDPALDIGATLWWYYPPEMRQEFLEIFGYADDNEFKTRMQVRMAMHCLNIILPRKNSFDSFDPEAFSENLTDFKAIIAGEENPQGYFDL
ncbi:MAG: phosphotransferase [Anaerolineaceae bacterium]|nr:phosphotransferase [Anaerolineaceae bacterium]